MWKHHSSTTFQDPPPPHPPLLNWYSTASISSNSMLLIHHEVDRGVYIYSHVQHLCFPHSIKGFLHISLNHTCIIYLWAHGNTSCYFLNTKNCFWLTSSRAQNGLVTTKWTSILHTEGELVVIFICLHQATSFGIV